MTDSLYKITTSCMTIATNYSMKLKWFSINLEKYIARWSLSEIPGRNIVENRNKHGRLAGVYKV